MATVMPRRRTPSTLAWTPSLTYRGERSKYFGGDAVATSISTIGRPKNLDSDFFHRQVIPADTLGPLVAAQPPELRALVTGFAAGYNRYIKDLKPGGANAACAGQSWVLPITADDVYRRMLAGNLAGGFSNFVAPIAEAQPPGAAAPARKADNADILPPALQVELAWWPATPSASAPPAPARRAAVARQPAPGTGAGRTGSTRPS